MTEFLYCGELISEGGLEPVASALKACSWRIELQHSGYDHTFYLRTPHTQREIDLEMDSGQSRRYLFSGGVDGTPERALSLIGEFSGHLSAGGFAHRIEICNEANELIGYFHLRWPQERG
jgi:hypothetical protein